MNSTRQVNVLVKAALPTEKRWYYKLWNIKSTQLRQLLQTSISSLKKTLSAEIYHAWLNSAWVHQYALVSIRKKMKTNQDDIHYQTWKIWKCFQVLKFCLVPQWRSRRAHQQIAMSATYIIIKKKKIINSYY